MKTNKPFIDPSLCEETQRKPEQGVDGRSMPSYARDLRVLGQLLERRNICSVDLVWVADTYIVRGSLCSKHQSLARRCWACLDAFIRGAWGAQSNAKMLEQRYNLEEIVRFDSLARSKRSGIDRMPDPYSLSHILRTAGAYLDGRTNSMLIGISLQKRWVTIRFETSEGRPEEARQDIEYFYNYWVKMYLRRGSRAKILPDGQALRIYADQH